MPINDVPPRDMQSSPNDECVTAAPIDFESLLSRCMGSAAFAMALINELEINGKLLVEPIVLHASNNKISPVAEAAHSLKGAAAIIGAESLREQAEAIEYACRDGQTSQLMEMVSELQNEMDRCICYLPTLRNRLSQGVRE